MTGHGAVLFDTALGACGLSWSPSGVTAVQLPHDDRSETLRALHRHVQDEHTADADAVPEGALAAIAGIQRLLDGQPEPLAEVVLDLAGLSEFDRRVYAAARTIGPGVTSTYGRLAESLGTPGAARAVGRALGRNPCPLVVPCHRILAADGTPGGFSGPGGRITKQRLLALERATPPTLFDV